MLPWLLVIVDDLDIVYSVFLPAETDPPLVVNTYAVPAQPVAFQRFQVISGRHIQVVQLSHDVKLNQFSNRDPGY